MTVFHGSFEVVSSPEVAHGRKKVDFGRGFYLTGLRDQAVSWARIVARRYPNAVAVLTEDEERIGYIPRNRNQELLGCFAGEMQLFAAVTSLGWRNKHCPAMTVAVVQDRFTPEDFPIIPIDE